MGLFMDGTGITPGTQGCNCQMDCEFPCWQRLGIAPACTSCRCKSFPESTDMSESQKDSQTIETLADAVSYQEMLTEIEPD